MSGHPYTELYRQRLMTADEAVSLIPSGAKVALGLGAAQPPALMEALARRARAGEVDGVRLYYMLSTGVAGASLLSLDCNERLRPVSLFHSGVERALDKQRAERSLPPLDVIPAHFSQVPRILCEHVGVDTLITTVAPMDEDGNFSLGTDPDYALAVALSGARVILEVNPRMPYVRGNCMIPLSRVAALVEHDTPLVQLPPATQTPTDKVIGGLIAEMVGNGACLQMGIGALPDAVCASLAGHSNLGIHTEMLTPGLAALVKSGVVDNSRKRLNAGKSVYAFSLGDQALYDFLDRNPDVEAHPVDYVNDPCVIARNDNVVSVNATLQIDLHGACNSEYMNGRQFSASGGQLDFVRGAYASKGGLSIIACHSTAAGGKVSRIVPRLSGPVTTPRTDVQYVITEHGRAELKGRTVSERARALIGLAHPDFREELEKAAFEEGLLS